MEIDIKGVCVAPFKCKPKTFNMVVPTFNGGAKLEVFINCFLAQSSDDWQLTVISDGREPETEKIMEKYPQDNISYHYLDVRYNDWGHTPREYGIYQSDAEWTLMSGFDNYYVPTFIEEFGKAAKTSDCDFIFCDFITNHVIGGGSYNGHIDSKLLCGSIDIGNFTVRTPLLKEVGFKSRAYAADWELVDSLIPVIEKRGTHILKIEQVLYVHN